MKDIVKWAMLLALLSASVSLSAETWRFLPCYHNDVRGIERADFGAGHFYDAVPQAVRKLAEGGGLSEEESREAYWHAVEFPHWDFVKLMQEERVFGWYGCEFDVPNALGGMDVLVDLGIIDDSDETFVNGAKIGATGRVPNGSAWQNDRLYRIPAGRLVPFYNYMAVHVWSLWGLGEIVGPPVLKAALLPQDAQWDVAFMGGEAPKAGLNSAKTFGKALSLFPNSGSLELRKESMP